MKRFRPYKAGFIVIYVLCVLCVVDAVYAIYGQITGTANELTRSFSIFTYLCAALSIVYVRIYSATRIEITDTTFHFVNPVYIRPQAGAKRAMFIYRSGDTDVKQVDKKFQLSGLVKYGYIEDLGYSRLDASGASETNALFPVHEIAFVMDDGKRYHVNGGYYSVEQLKQINALIEKATGLKPEGALINPTKPVKKKETKGKKKK